MELRAPDRLGTTRLPDGRALAWAEWGPEDGVPVVLHPGAGTSRRLGFGAPVLAGLGVRLVSIDRPGLGASDPRPGRTLTDWAEDVAHLARERGLGVPAMVGYSQGAPFALACAAAGAAAAVAVVCGTDELSHPALRPGLDPELGRLVDAATADPDAAQAGFAAMDAAALRAMTLDMSGEADRAVFADPAFAREFAAAVDDAFRQGPGGYARDTVLAMRPWPFDLGRVGVPVDLWYGALDTSPVHSPDLGATLAGRLPRARRRVADDRGSALLWTDADAILRDLLAASASARR
jgi:pimeloyl-ACP methyl ester carboxylesterase